MIVLFANIIIITDLEFLLNNNLKKAIIYTMDTLYYWHYFLSLVWLFLPAGCANMFASLSKIIPILNYPLDFNRTFKGQALLGSHKTWRGFFFGIVAAILMAYIQKINYEPSAFYYLYEYDKINFWLLGFLSGFGALFGDALRSFIKRRRGIPPGKLWFPYDQIDWIIGAIIFMSFYLVIDWKLMVIAILLSVVIHPIVNYLSYILKLQKNKF